MENASKALIIAGAILLSILIIALGMAVYNNASSVQGSADLSGEEINAHNQQLTSYRGRIKGTQVKALLNKIQMVNKEYQDRIIDVTFSANTTKQDVPEHDNASASDPVYVINGVTGSVTPSIKAMRENTKDSTTYYVTFGEGDNGIINGCEIHIYSNND